MTPTSTLLQDVFTFVSTLAARDYPPMRTRFLSPRVVQQFNALMLDADFYDAARHKANRPRAPRLRTERQTERVRWIHFLAEAAQLVALTGRFLKPTPHFAAWLASSAEERLQILFDATFPSSLSSAHWVRWRAYHLPGAKFTSPAIVVEPFLALLRELPTASPVRMATLARALKLPSFEADDPDQHPVILIHALLKLVRTFGALHWHKNSTFQLTSQGASLLHQTLLSPSMPPEPSPLPIWKKARAPLDPPTLYITNTFPLARLYPLTQLATLQSVHRSAIARTRVYTLDSNLIHRALDYGTSLAAVRDSLETITAAPLPPNVNVWLDAITRHYGQIILRRATLMQVPDPARLTELARAKQIRECFQQTLSPRAVIVKPTHIKNLVRRLQWRGEQPRLELDLDDLTNRPSDKPTIRLFDNPTLAHLYLSARLVHQLTDLIPPAYRPPYSLLLNLEKNLDTRDRETINALLAEFQTNEQAKQKSRPRRSTIETTERDFAPAPQHLESNLSKIQTALSSNTPFQMTYYSPYTDETTTRVVEPLRLEYRDDTAYLIAYCRLDQAERTFRVDRILQIHGEPSRTIADSKLQMADRR